jgi:hypothetical protein
MSVNLAPIADISPELVADHKRKLWTARHEAEGTMRYVPIRLFDALYDSESAHQHYIGLAAYAVFLADLYGYNDRDWLHL